MRQRQTRGDGFAGQHFIVVPEPARRAASRHPLLRGLLVTDAGYFPRADGHRVDRAQGAPTHLVIACLKGSGWVRQGDGPQDSLKAGDMVWLDAHAAHAYGASLRDPWTIAWAHFTGEEVPEWRKLLGWPGRGNQVGHLPAGRMAELKLDLVYRELEAGYAPPRLVAAAAALRCSFCKAARLWAEAGPALPAAQRVAALCEQLREDPRPARSLDELASSAGLSVPHFSQLFRRQTGHAPIDYLIRLRIQRACRLLDTTDETVAKIGAEAGYEDPYYFARSFRRVMGCSPRAYRRIVKG